MSRTVLLSRRVRFSSGHRYWKPGLSDDENRRLFGPWASPYNHGHNYVLWVTCEGTLDERTGMVVNIKQIDDVLKDRIVARFDQRSLNDEVPEFADRPTTMENMLLLTAGLLGELPGNIKLAGLRLLETEDLASAMDKSGNLALIRTYEFAAAHRLASSSLSTKENEDLFGICTRPNFHGHNFLLEVTVGGEPNPETGMILDLSRLDEIVTTEILDRYDHMNLNMDVPELQGKNPTSENIAIAIFDRLKAAMPWKLEKVRLFETPRSHFEVTA